MALTFRNARTTIENLIVDRLSLAYGERLPASATVASLRARPSTGLPDQKPVHIYVTAAGFVYRWRPFSLVADDGAATVKPSDVLTGNPGRWVVTTSTTQTGYLKTCDLYNDDSGSEDIIEQRIYGECPAILISFEGNNNEPKSHRPGAQYWSVFRFQVMVISVSMRGEQTARQGSGIVSELAIDPGTAAMLGDVKSSLAGVSGETLGEDSIANIEIGDEEPVLKDLARRRFVEAIEIEVRATLDNPDTDLLTLEDPWEFNIQQQLAQNSTSIFDVSNYVSSGMSVPLGNGFTKTVAAGTMYVNGSLLSIAAESHSFDPSTKTYRDISEAGDYTYQEVALGSDPPPVALGSVRVGVTVTDSTGVHLDQILADSLINYGPADKVAYPRLLQVVAATPYVAVGGTYQFAVTATYTDGTVADVTSLCTFASSDTTVATVTAGGLATGLLIGTAYISASFDSTPSIAAVLSVGVIGMRRVISQPADGSDFMVTLPATMPSDTYTVTGSIVNGSGSVSLKFPDSAANDRTTTQFRVVTSSSLSNGDAIDIVIVPS